MYGLVKSVNGVLRIKRIAFLLFVDCGCPSHDLSGAIVYHKRDPCFSYFGEVGASCVIKLFSSVSMSGLW